MHRPVAGFRDDPRRGYPVHITVILRQGLLIKSPTERLTQNTQDDQSPSNSEDEADLM